MPLSGKHHFQWAKPHEKYAKLPRSSIYRPCACQECKVMITQDDLHLTNAKAFEEIAPHLCSGNRMTATTINQAMAVAPQRQQAHYFEEILTQSGGSQWTLSLPAQLKSHQHELETLLSKVFRGRCSPENLPLAQQLSLNWCMSKCRQAGLSFDDCIR